MALHVIIDGYNLIRQSDFFSPIDHRDLQQGRHVLIDQLAAYKRIKQHRITVVFDGANAPFFSERRNRIAGIDVLFSRTGELADHVIKRLAARERSRAVIVTSDRDIVRCAHAQGAATISAPEFEQKLMLAAADDMPEMKPDEDLCGWIPTTRKKGPRKRLPRHKRRNRRKTRKL